MTLRTRLQRLERRKLETPMACTLSNRELAQIIMNGRMKARRAGLEEVPSDLSDTELGQVIGAARLEEGAAP